MVTPDLAKYVRTQREKGLTDPQIRQVLVGNGWNDADLDSVLNATSSQLDVIMAGSANTEETVLD